MHDHFRWDETFYSVYVRNSFQVKIMHVHISFRSVKTLLSKVNCCISCKWWCSFKLLVTASVVSIAMALCLFGVRWITCWRFCEVLLSSISQIFTRHLLSIFIIFINLDFVWSRWIWSFVVSFWCNVIKIVRRAWWRILNQGDHLPGKPGNVREFDSCQGNVRDFTENQGIVREKIFSGKSCLKLFIVNCIFVSIQVFSWSLLCLEC